MAVTNRTKERGGPTSPNFSFKGKKGNITADSYSMEHVRKCNENAKKETHQAIAQVRGVPPKIDEQNFLYSELKKSKESMVGPERTDAKKQKPHVGGDALLFDHMKKQKQQHAASSSGSVYQGAAPKVGADAFNIAKVRVTKPQMPPATRQPTYQGIKPSMTSDTYHLNFLKSAKKANGNGGFNSNEVRL